MSWVTLQATIDEAWEERERLSPGEAKPHSGGAGMSVVKFLDGTAHETPALLEACAVK